MNGQQVRERVLAQFPDAQVEVQGDGCNFSLTVSSETFRELSQVERQKAVYRLFSDELRSGDLHALSVRAQAP